MNTINEKIIEYRIRKLKEIQEYISTAIANPEILSGFQITDGAVVQNNQVIPIKTINVVFNEILLNETKKKKYV